SYAFDRTGGYALKAKVFDPNVDPVPADSVQWAIQVRGVIRAFEPNLAEISLEPRQETTFELIPFNANNDSIEFWWTLNEADTMSIESTLSISFQDTGRYVVTAFARQEAELDSQIWFVRVENSLDVRGEGGAFVPGDLTLDIFPNPFNDRAEVAITAPTIGAASLALFDVRGREVWSRRIQLTAGQSRITIGEGAVNAPGVYLIKFESGGRRLLRKVVVLK
ncbi:MAG: T9SS type A sorting domain-containing protein, partial [Calditrichaeota bacterium]|nr:T9SS type A sorting domain-containing protein [Calditrichota bacterium]